MFGSCSSASHGRSRHVRLLGQARAFGNWVAEHGAQYCNVKYCNHYVAKDDGCFSGRYAKWLVVAPVVKPCKL